MDDETTLPENTELPEEEESDEAPDADDTVGGTPDPSSPVGFINRGIEAHDRKNAEAAKRQFAMALLGDPQNEMAWLWLAEVSNDKGERLYCLNRAVEINPDSRGRARRDGLRAGGVAPAVPPVIADLEKPKVPPSLRDVSEPARPRIRIPIRNPRAVRGKAIPSDDDTQNSPDGAYPRSGQRWPMIVAGLLALLAVISFVAVLAHREESDVFYIAVAGPLTGEDAMAGDSMQNAALIARDDFNASVTRGPKMELVFFDDQNDPEKAKEIAQEIVDDHRFVGVIGHGTSTTSIAAAPIYEKAGLPAISPLATIDSLSQYPNYFRTIFANSTEATIPPSTSPRYSGRRR